MEELSQNLEQIINRAKSYESKWQNEVKEIKIGLDSIFLGTKPPISQSVAVATAASPQQLKKRPKRLSAVVDEGECDVTSGLGSKSVLSESDIVVNETIPSVPVEVKQQKLPEPEHVFARPMRAAKLKTENCLKEPSINSKMRRPDNPNESTRKIKKENEQRPSQVNSKKSNKSNKSQNEAVPPTPAASDSVSSIKKVDDSLVVLADKESPLVEISDEDVSSSSSVVAKKKSKTEEPVTQNIVVKVKKEKSSLSGVEKRENSPVKVTELATATHNHEITSSIEEYTISTENTTATTVRRKRGRKKQFKHRPIKEERLSIEPAVPSPVSTRTRSGSTSKPRPDSVYEDAVENIAQDVIKEQEVNDGKRLSPSSIPLEAAAVPAVANIKDETAVTNNVTMVTACDSTFVANSTFAMPAPQTTFIMENNPDATVTISKDTVNKPNGSLGDATFDVRDPPANDSIMTEDDSFDKPLVKLITKPLPPPPPPMSAKVLRSKSKPNELFNPCVQSPVKKKVEAFEHHAQAATHQTRLKTTSKKTKENLELELPSIRDIKASTVTTPLIGKPHAPLLGRFLTPTQQSNVTPTANNAKKLPNSASKIMAFPTSKQASNLKYSSSTSSQSLSRENSEDDLKKGFNKLQQLADERKKKRELKHQQAAQIREAKDKERAERLKKMMKEREEKNRKKALEIEQKKRELEEINRNLKLQEERELKQTKTKMDAAEAARQERELLDHLMPKMKMPPPPKQHKYNFNMLHSDDSTDEEGKTSYKRPTPPLWSKSSVRADHINSQAHLPSDIIDSFFSVQPMTPDLKAIFPNIDSRYLKRNSSAIWQTPPRYSEMPKY